MTFSPTITTDLQPSSCHVCGRQASGIGLGPVGRGDPRMMCTECLLLLEKVKDVRRWTPYELKARHAGMEAAGPLVEANGSDLAEWTEEQVLEFVGTIWRGCADGVHRALQDGEAPW